MSRVGVDPALKAAEVVRTRNIALAIEMEDDGRAPISRPPDGLPTAEQDPVDGTEQLGPLVYAVRTDLPLDHDKLWPRATSPPPTAPTTEAALRPAAPVTSLAEQRARRTGHPCTGADPE